MKGKIRFKGGNIHYQDSGSGNAIVLLHGFLESMKIWDFFATALSGSFRVISVDLPGFGKSENISPVHTMELMAQCVKAVLHELSVPECVMVGHSMGGYTALSFALQFPEMLKGLLLFHSQAGADSPEAKANRERATAVVRAEHHLYIKNFIPTLFASGNVKIYFKEIEELMDDADSVSKETIVAALEGMKMRNDSQHLLSDLDIPICFIIGKNDSRIHYREVLYQASLPKHSEVLLLGDTGHMGFIEAKETTFRVLRDFCRRCYDLDTLSG